MNINDFKSEVPIETNQTFVTYVRPNFDLEKRFQPNTNVSLKGRQDLVGKIDRLEDGNVVVKILGETYAVPPQEFDSLFYVHEPDSPENWYSKLKYQMNKM